MLCYVFLMSSITALPISGAPEQEHRTIPTTFYIQKIFFTEQTWTSTFTRKYTTNNYENAECEYGVRL